MNNHHYYHYYQFYYHYFYYYWSKPYRPAMIYYYLRKGVEMRADRAFRRYGMEEDDIWGAVDTVSGYVTSAHDCFGLTLNDSGLQRV